ncbi:LysR family transcriptional regulator [Kibdelosporangium aridum]|uniref:LysR family transcriptional regulator n=1 Tax=Kibdelosporangium aridum TaxID=2030 RepID=A0A428YZX1_KIBAR|nr:LysR family transcriptional regulator [Kibdelosporangium aridum]RSM77310.1 LysR family transcriptional regulator [Kibdelosporangium aridum]
MELREMRAFVAVVEEGGLSAAARRLHVSQPALSQTMNALERELDVRLLVRSSTGVRPTEAGMTLLTEARAVLARYDQAIAALTRRAGTTLRLGIPLELPEDLLSAALAELTSAFPDTKVQARHLSTAAQLAALTAGELDVGLLREHPIGQELDAVLVAEEPLGVLLAVGEIDGTGSIRLDALAGMDWVGFARTESPAWYDEITAILRSHGIDIGTPQDQPLIADVKLAAVSAGRVFALAPPKWSRPVPESLEWRPLTGNPLIRRTWAAWPAASRRRDLGHLVAALEKQYL